MQTNVCGRWPRSHRLKELDRWRAAHFLTKLEKLNILHIHRCYKPHRGGAMRGIVMRGSYMCRTGVMQDPLNELRIIPVLRTWVNRPRFLG